jgi:hypothetical protein
MFDETYAGIGGLHGEDTASVYVLRVYCLSSSSSHRHIPSQKTHPLDEERNLLHRSNGSAFVDEEL